MQAIRLLDFLSDHSSDEKVVDIRVEPETIYFEDGRDANFLNFDFVLEGRTEKQLEIKFIKVAVYDNDDRLLTYQYLNHNAVGPAGIHTLGQFEINGKEQFDLYNPFYRFPKHLNIGYLRYMFTFYDPETKKEYYAGNVMVKPEFYDQQVRLDIPLKGVMTILDGHDYYSHHRRFSMTIVRKVTDNHFWSNFSRYAVDLVVIGEDGNLRRPSGEAEEDYDFHFADVKSFYTHEATVYAPADGVVVEVVDTLEDLYDRKFDSDEAFQEGRYKDLAGNYVIIQHNATEFSHLFHLLKGSVLVEAGEEVRRGEEIGKVGFSGAATTYSHLHYQLMDGQDFLRANALPCKFSNVSLMLGSETIHFPEAVVDTGDVIVN